MTLVFPPDGVSTAQLLGEIAEDLHAHGQDVRVITTAPHYNVDARAQERQPVSWKRHRLYGTSIFGPGIEVFHLRMPHKAVGASGRILQWAWFHLGSFLLAMHQRKKYDVIMTVSPPPTVATVASAIRKLTGKPYVYAVWELYPEILVKLGKVRRASRLHKVLQRIERSTYRQADHITVLHAPMRESVVAAAPGIGEKVTVVPTFADVNYLTPGSRETSLRETYGIEEEFVIGYAGNLGVSQDLTPAIEAVAQLPEHSISFLICGDGTERRRLEGLASSNQRKNIIFAGHLPYDMVPEILATADLSLVVLAPGVGSEALPSKAYRIMACGRPLLVVADLDSPLAKLVQETKVGLTVSPDSPDDLATAIEWAIGNQQELREMGARARTVATDRFSRDVVTEKYEQLLAAASKRART